MNNNENNNNLELYSEQEELKKNLKEILIFNGKKIYYNPNSKLIYYEMPLTLKEFLNKIKNKSDFNLIKQKINKIDDEFKPMPIEIFLDEDNNNNFDNNNFNNNFDNNNFDNNNFDNNSNFSKIIEPGEINNNSISNNSSNDSTDFSNILKYNSNKNNFLTTFNKNLNNNNNNEKYLKIKSKFNKKIIISNKNNFNNEFKFLTKKKLNNNNNNLIYNNNYNKQNNLNKKNLLLNNFTISYEKNLFFYEPFQIFEIIRKNEKNFLPFITVSIDKIIKKINEINIEIFSVKIIIFLNNIKNDFFNFFGENKNKNVAYNIASQKFLFYFFKKKFANYFDLCDYIKNNENEPLKIIKDNFNLLLIKN